MLSTLILQIPEVPPKENKDFYPGDGLSVHELLQNAWLEANGYGVRGAEFSQANLVVAIKEDPMHKYISSAQKTNKMNVNNLRFNKLYEKY